jgi:hypothetical protein
MKLARTLAPSSTSLRRRRLRGRISQVIFPSLFLRRSSHRVVQWGPRSLSEALLRRLLDIHMWSGRLAAKNNISGFARVSRAARSHLKTRFWYRSVNHVPGAYGCN